MAEAVGFIFTWASKILSIEIAVFEYSFTMWQVIIFCFLLYICTKLVFGVFGGD